MAEKKIIEGTIEESTTQQESIDHDDIYSGVESVFKSAEQRRIVRTHEAAIEKANNECIADAEAHKKQIEAAKAARAIRKARAKNMLFFIALMSAIMSTCMFSIIIWVVAEPTAWIFAVMTTMIGMINTLLHTYLYRYIREEIYRK